MGSPSSSPSFTYASDEVGALSRVVIRVIETCTGQPKIKRLYEHYTRRGRPPELFWDDAVEALQLNIRSNRSPAECIPKTGPVLGMASAGERLLRILSCSASTASSQNSSGGRPRRV